MFIGSYKTASDVPPIAIGKTAQAHQVIAKFDLALADLTKIGELEVAKSGIRIDPIFGPEAQEIIARLYASPQDVMTRLQSIVRLPK